MFYIDPWFCCRFISTFFPVMFKSYNNFSSHRIGNHRASVARISAVRKTHRTTRRTITTWNISNSLSSENGLLFFSLSLSLSLSVSLFSFVRGLRSQRHGTSDLSRESAPPFSTRSGDQVARALTGVFRGNEIKMTARNVLFRTGNSRHFASLALLLASLSLAPRLSSSRLSSLLFFRERASNNNRPLSHPHWAPTGQPPSPSPSPVSSSSRGRTVVERIAFCSAPPCPVLCFRESPCCEEMTNKWAPLCITAIGHPRVVMAMRRDDRRF